MILLTGATGFLGGAAVAWLLGPGDEDHLLMALELYYRPGATTMTCMRH